MIVIAVGNRESYRSALAKGLGRALQAPRASGTFIDEDATLDACLHNRCFDPQIEGSRAPWLIEILASVDAVDRFQAPILQALPESSAVWDVAQLCDFAEFYARRGVDDARKALYRVLEKSPDASAPWLAEEQIVRLEGIKGFLMIAERRGAAIRSGEDVSDLPLLATEVERTHGAEVVENALADAAIHNQDILAYRVSAAGGTRRMGKSALCTASETI